MTISVPSRIDSSVHSTKAGASAAPRASVGTMSVPESGDQLAVPTPLPAAGCGGPVKVLSEGESNQHASRRCSPAPGFGKPWATRYGYRLFLGDLIGVTWAAVGAHLVHIGTLSTRVSRDPDSLPFVAMTVFVAAAWIVALHWGGTRDSEVVGHGPEEYKRLVRTSLGLFGAIAICSYVFNLHLPRAYVLVMLPAGLVALMLSRFTWRRWLHARRRNGAFMSQVLVVGNLRTVRELLTDLHRAPLAGYSVLGVCVQQTSSPGDLSVDPLTGHPSLDGVPVLGGLDEVAAIAERHGADTVAVTSTAAFGPAAVRRLSWELEKTDIQLVLAPALTNIAGTRIHTKPVAGLPLIHVDRPTYRGANRILKRSFDAIGSALLLGLFSPLILGVGIAVKVSSPGPVLFRQERAGLNGKSFRMFKFRSMVEDAESRLAELTKHHRDAGNPTMFKMQEDPRVTRVGKFIRRFSLDELPQLINVLKGDMSLVGPRPPLLGEVATYHGEAKLRLLVRPGMTGLWQVSGRSTLTWEDTVRLDTYYVENWSLTSDLVILWKTLKAVVSTSGAY